MQDRLQKGQYCMYQIDGTLLWQLAVGCCFLFSAAISCTPPPFSRWPENSLAGRIHYTRYEYDFLLLATLHYHPHAHLLIGTALVVVGASSFFQML